MKTPSTLMIGLIAATASADPTQISGLFPTGVDDSGHLVPPGSADPHYKLTNGVAHVAIPNPAWTNSDHARWIGPTANGNDNVNAGLYDYTTTFVLPSNALPDTVHLKITLASDDFVYLLVNGHATGLPNPQNEFTNFTTFNVDGRASPYFVVDTNKLTFRVYNVGPNTSPSGLLISDISGSYRTNIYLAVDLYPGILISGPIGSTNQIEFIPMVPGARWTPLTNVVLDESPVLIIDRQASGSANRFYRVAGGNPIPPIFPTGVDDQGAPLQYGATDPHYTLNGDSAFVASPDPRWITAANSRWLCTSEDGSSGVPTNVPQDYTTMFVVPSNALPSSVCLTVTLAVDDYLRVLVDGDDAGFYAFQDWHANFSTIAVVGYGSAHLVLGTNELTFRVFNVLAQSPAGLLITNIAGSYLNSA